MFHTLQLTSSNQGWSTKELNKQKAQRSLAVGTACNYKPKYIAAGCSKNLMQPFK